ncbi:MAG: NADAR family protein [Lewinellaceae bacterium]|nr:NADAR family protein [Lewinellaceae bacterium]
MGNGEIAYRLREGLHPTSSDLVHIFELERDLYQESTVKEQKAFFDQWNKSNRQSKYSKPKYTVESFRADEEFLFFWGHQGNKNGIITKSCLSQWWPCNFEKDGVIYSSAEQWMMAEKARAFLDKKMLELILSTSDPKEAKRLGRMVSNFNEDVWSLKSYSIVVEGNFLKFSQNPELSEYLISTEKKILVEASPYDNIWGIGMKKGDKGINNPKNWNGKNLLGFALMEVRDALQQVILP